jgi:hypothetical protein
MLSLLLAAQVAAVASDAAPAPAVVPPVVADAPTSITLPALTIVRIRVLADLASKQSVTGDEFDIELIEPIAVSGGYVVPAGTKGRGWVIHADKARFGGKAGELLLGARYLKLGDVEIPLRSMKLGARPAKDNSGVATGVMVAGGVVGGVAAMFITGGQARVATGMEAMAKTASNVDLPISLLIGDDRFFVPVQAVAAPAPAPASQASVSQPK